MWSPRGEHADIGPRMLNRLRKNIVNTIASRHVVGTEIGEALPVCRWAEGVGFRSILAPWARSQDSRQAMFDRYRSAMESVAKENFNCYVSIKLEAIGYDSGLFAELVQVAKSMNVRLHLDSLGPDSAPVSFSYLERVAGVYGNLGCTLPARWLRSLSDAERAIEMGLAVRIVKGQWEDPGNARVDCKQNYLVIAGKLAAGARCVGVATHDLPLAEKALRLLSSAKTNCEFEQLSTLPLNGMRSAKKLGCPYRLYVAYGQPGIPYNTKFALSRPGMVAWVLADFTFKPKKPWAGNVL